MKIIAIVQQSIWSLLGL